MKRKQGWFSIFWLVLGIFSFSQAALGKGLTLVSEDFEDGGKLPARFTCDGARDVPQVTWSGVPSGTKSLALIMDHHVSTTDIHTYWVVYNLSPNQSRAGADVGSASLGINTVNGKREYTPPCSKGPGEKQYIITLYALSQKVPLSSALSVSRESLLQAMSGKVLDSSALQVSYDRTGVAQTGGHHADGPQGGAHGGANLRAIAMRGTPVAAEKSTHPRCQEIYQTVHQAGFDDVQVSCDSEYAYLTSDTYPDHDVMNGIRGTNEQVPVPALDYAAPVKLAPAFSPYLTSIDAALGVAVNGVPIYDYSAQGELDIYQYDATADTVKLGQLDNCGGHAGRGDDYHYHASPDCMIAAMKNRKSNPIIGWGYDGYPLYGNRNPDGSAIAKGKLDVCNGQRDSTFGYRYHTSEAPPYIIQCLVGEVDTHSLPRVHPMRGDSRMRDNLRPPENGVDNLTYSQQKDGSRTMRYQYRGDSYYVIYSPSAKGEHCFDFKQKTVSNGGKVETGTFCREGQRASPQSASPMASISTGAKGASSTQVRSVTLPAVAVASFGRALADQVKQGDGAGIDPIFRNSGVLIDEQSQTYFAVNGVHPVQRDRYDAYYPKSIVQASLADDRIVKAYPFSQVRGHSIDMEALSFAPEAGHILIGDEYNFVYLMSLQNGKILKQWDLADIGIKTAIDKGIEAMSYSSADGTLYVGIQNTGEIIGLKLGTGERVSRQATFSLPRGASPSGLFAHKDGSLYVLSMGNGRDGQQRIYQYSAQGNLLCEVAIPSSLGIVRPDGLFIDSEDKYAYIADSQGPLKKRASLYKVRWNNLCQEGK